jgi:hypothetical protein
MNTNANDVTADLKGSKTLDRLEAMKKVFVGIATTSLLFLAGCSGNVTGNSANTTNISGLYVGTTSARSANPGGVEIASGEIAAKIEIIDTAGYQSVSYKNIKWKGADLSYFGFLVGVQGSKSGSDVALILNLGPGCTNPVIQGTAFADRLEMRAGSLAYSCPLREAGTITWAAFNFVKQ